MSESQQAFGAVTEEVLTLESLLSDKYEGQVSRYLSAYRRSSPARTQALHERISIYFPMIEHKLHQAGLPMDLKYLTLVESRLVPKARSHVGATGLWQMMTPTARYCGLTVDYWFDERLDPERATEAAIYYLQDLYEQFQDWGLVMAAYNAGPGRVRKAIRLARSNSFEEVIRYLPRETRQYVPRFFAAKAYMENHSKNNRVEQPVNPDQWWTTKIFLDERLSLAEAADRLEIDITLLRQLNPSWRYNQIGKGKSYFIRIPERLLSAWWASSESVQEIGLTQIDREVDEEGLPIFSQGLYREFFLPAFRHQNLLELGQDIGINPYRIAQWNGMAVNTPLSKGEPIRLILPANHECLSHLIHLMAEQEELAVFPPAEIRQLSYDLPVLESSEIATENLVPGGVGAQIPIGGNSPELPMVINRQVFSQILQRKRHRSFPFDHKESQDESWAYYFSEN